MIKNIRPQNNYHNYRRQINLFFKDFIYFYERGREREGKGEKTNVWCLSYTPPGDPARNPGMCPDWESNQRPFASQLGTQSTEPHRPGRRQINLM